MRPSDCPNCTLFQFIATWSLNSGPFWAFLIIIAVWVRQSLKLDGNADPKQDHPKEPLTKWLQPYIKTRAQLLIAFFLHIILLAMLFVEGYWILQLWWQYIQGFWTWELNYCEWSKQFYQFVMIVFLGLLLPILLSTGLLLVMTDLGSLGELLEWKFGGEAVEGSQPSESSRTKTDHTE